MNKELIQIEQDIVAKYAEIKEALAVDHQGIMSFEELCNIGRWPELEQELFELYKKQYHLEKDIET